jgi:tetratricopeptide (TPR) repeat protein
MKSILFLTIFLPLTMFGQSTIEKAKALYESSKYEEVEKLLNPIKEESSDYAAARYYLGRTAFDKKQYDDASDYFEEATEANEKVADYFLWLGNTYGVIAQDANMLKQGMLAPKMKKAWEAAIVLDTKNIDARLSLIQYYRKAPGFMGGSIENAKEVASQILKLKPAEGHRQLGEILLSEKKTTEAEKEFIEMAKADAWYNQILASFYVGQKQYEKAFNLLEDILKQNPKDYSAIYQIGKTSAISGQKLDRGEECLKKYLSYSPKKEEPSLAGAHMRLAQIKEKRGSKAEAKMLFETALRMDGSLKEAKDGLERVSK